jgi:energy-converting hydrogenase Eha subunit E
MNAAVYVGAALVAVGALASFLIPRRRQAAQTEEPEARLEAA